LGIKRERRPLGRLGGKKGKIGRGFPEEEIVTEARSLSYRPLKKRPRRNLNLKKPVAWFIEVQEEISIRENPKNKRKKGDRKNTFDHESGEDINFPYWRALCLEALPYKGGKITTMM